MKNINKKSKGEMKNILDEIRKQEQMFKEGYEIGVENERAKILEIIDKWEWKDCFCSKMNGVCRVCDESERLKARIKGD